MSSKKHKGKKGKPAEAKVGTHKAQTSDEPVQKAAASEKVQTDAAELEDVERVRSEYGHLMDRLKRVSAEFQNYRKRVEEQRETWSYAAIEAFVLDLLPVFDNLDRAIDAVKTAKSPDDIVSGIRIIESHLTKVLESHGVERIHCLREPFDPSCHEAVEVDHSERHPEPVVLKEYQRGYRFGGKVVKPAMVRVSSKEPQEVQSEELLEDSASEESSGESKENESADV